MDDEQKLQGVLRQRRNFLLASSLLAAFLFLDVEFSEVQIFGVKFLMHNKSNLIWVLFGWWLYLFWRYYQYHSALYDHKSIQKYYGTVHRFADPIVQRAARKAYPDCPHSDHARYGEVEAKSFFVARFKGKLHFPTEDPTKLDFRDAPFEMSRVWFFIAHAIALPVAIFNDHGISDYLLPYAVGFFLAAIFLLKVVYA